MFSAKNYGLPKDLIEAAKRVHEKQLMEYDEDGHIDNPPKGMDKGTKKDREKAAKMGLKGPHLEGEGRVTKKQKQNIPPLPVRKPKNEEVQFTEEELAEAFAIFLEENFHVEMLTEEDLDYVFENEFPQWLEESLAKAFAKPTPEERRGRSNTLPSFPGEDALIKKEREKLMMTGGLDDAAGPGRQLPSTPPSTQPSTPPSTARKQTGGPSLFQQAKKAVRPTPGDSGRTAIDRLKYMAQRGNKASQKVLSGPKKDWRASVFTPKD